LITERKYPKSAYVSVQRWSLALRPTTIHRKSAGTARGWYRSGETEAKLAEPGKRSHIHRRGSRGKPLTPRQEAANKARSKVRARVEHVFGNQHSAMGGKFVRTIGMARATMKIGMQNLAYNMRRLVVLERSAITAG
tara:strand:+ start:13395 stop:13805 length:411 start_codon:yes stop_codon:yes gene_type:complete